MNPEKSPKDPPRGGRTEAAAVRHVYTSAPSPYPTPESSLVDGHFRTRQALAGSHLGWTILRAFRTAREDALLAG